MCASPFSKPTPQKSLCRGSPCPPSRHRQGFHGPGPQQTNPPALKNRLPKRAFPAACGLPPKKRTAFGAFCFPARHTACMFPKRAPLPAKPLAPGVFSKRPSVCLLFPVHGNLLLSFFNTLPRIFPFVNAKEALFHVFLNFLKRTK